MWVEGSERVAGRGCGARLGGAGVDRWVITEGFVHAGKNTFACGERMVCAYG